MLNLFRFQFQRFSALGKALGALGIAALLVAVKTPLQCSLTERDFNKFIDELTISASVRCGGRVAVVAMIELTPCTSWCKFRPGIGGLRELFARSL